MDTWIVLLLIGLLSLIGRGRRQSKQKPPRSSPPLPPPRRRWQERPAESRRPEPGRSAPRRPRVDPLPTWKPQEPEEIEAWADESEIPAAWLPDLEPPPTEPRPERAESQALLERLSRAAEEATRSRRGGAAAQAGKESAPAGVETGAPLRQELRQESPRLRELRGRLASPQSLRQVLLLKEILGPPRARRRGPFPA